MIAMISVRQTADKPNFPLRPLAVFTGSSMTLGVVDVPPTREGIAVTGVSLAVENATGAVVSASAVESGGVWTATIPASHFAAVGVVAMGVTISASGTDENGAARSWIVGKGDLSILPADGVPVPGETLQNVHLRDAVPATPLKGDLCEGTNGWQIYTGEEWAVISPDLSNYATKADATLTGRTGYTDWQYGALAVSDRDWTWIYSAPEYSNGTWTTEITNGPEFVTMTATGPENATSLSFTGSGEGITASGSATRTALSGYRLGPDDEANPNRDKLLASEAEAEALRTALTGKFDKSGGEVTGPISVTGNRAAVAVGGETNAAILTSARIVVIRPDGSSYVMYGLTLPEANGTIALAAGTGHADNLAALDSGGNPVDSGKKPADFATAAQGEKAEDSVQRAPDNANPNAKTAVTIGVRSTENTADRGQASLAVGDHPKASGKNAVATGTWTQATGQDAHAEGNLGQATNYGAHAEGNNTRATGAYSHAEGTDTVASGLVTHAEGNYATAEGTGAHAEGMFSKASGPAAHAEGCNLDKLADLLQAAGASAEIVALFRQAATDAAGSFSHTEGLVSATSEMGSHAQGFRASDGGKQFSFVWQGYSGQVPTAAQMQALLDDPTSQDAQIALQCLVTALTARAAYTSKGPGTFCINPVSQGGSTDPKSGFFIGDESLDKALRYSFHTATVSSGATPAVTNLADRAINTVTLGSSVTAATVTLSGATSGVSRDFFVDLAIEATTAPTLTFIDPATGTTANVAFGADSLADIDTGYNLVLFTELPNNRWLVSVKHEEAAS